METSSEIRIVGVRFHEAGRLYHFDASDHQDVQIGDFVIVETSRGRMLGQVMGVIPSDRADLETTKPVLRPATARDLVMQQVWREKEDEALATCQEKAAQLGGLNNAKFLKAIYNFDGSTLTLLYTVEQQDAERADIKKLKQALRKSFRVRIELRQVGPRDAAKLLGGFGACGESQCCSTFLTEFSPISIRMAKIQGVSLNPSEITGMCGRLRCCLIYENDQYAEAMRHLPKLKKRVQTPYGEGKVVELHPLRGTVIVQIGERHYELQPDEVQALSG